jgi:hypothetical protein
MLYEHIRKLTAQSPPIVMFFKDTIKWMTTLFERLTVTAGFGNGQVCTITIYDSTTALSTTNIAPIGVLVGVTLPPLVVSVHNLRAVYSGDANYPPDESSVHAVAVVAKCSQRSLVGGRVTSPHRNLGPRVGDPH